MLFKHGSGLGPINVGRNLATTTSLHSFIKADLIPVARNNLNKSFHLHHIQTHIALNNPLLYIA